MNKQKLKIIDIGHQNLNLENALSLLETTISKTLYEGDARAVKVITGHGSGKLREFVRSWLDEQEIKMKKERIFSTLKFIFIL